MSSSEAAAAWQVNLRAGLAPQEALRRLRAALRAGEVAARTTAFYLADIADRRAFLDLGSSSLKHFGEHQLGLAESTTREYVAVGRALPGLPHIDAAFAQGRLSWRQVKALIPIATPETESAWVEWSVGRTSRQVEKQARRREKGDLPTDPEKRRIHTVHQDVRGRLNPTQWELWRRCRAKLEAETGEALSDVDLLMEVARLVLETRPDGTVPGRTPVKDAHYQLHAHVCTECGQATTTGEDGEPQRISVVELTQARRARAAPAEGEDDSVPPSAAAPESATQIALPSEAEGDAAKDPAPPATAPEPAKPTVPPSEAGDEAAKRPSPVDVLNVGPPVPAELRAPPTPAPLREAVIHRDGYRCRCCGGKAHLTVHHLKWRMYGGATAVANLLTLCEGCHSLVHARLLILLGSDASQVTFVDRLGRSVERRLHLDHVTFEVIAGEGAVRRLGEPRPLDLHSLPAEVDAAWWVRHQHLLRGPGPDGALSLRPGFPREPAREPEASAVAEQRTRLGGLESLQGQQRVRDLLQIAIAAARARGEPLGHLLLAGPAGVGKTRLATAIAAELGYPVTRVMAPLLRTPEALVRTLTSLPAGSVLFLDEIHSLPARVAEALYEALDSGSIHLPIRADGEQRTLHVQLAPFTLVGATTDEHRLPRPLLSRLMCERLDYYGDRALQAILQEAATDQGLRLGEGAAAFLAGASRGTPRRALQLLAAVRDAAQVADRSEVNRSLAEHALAALGVDAAGFTELDRAYLRHLERSGPLSLKSLAARLGTTEAVLEQTYEPFLLRQGLIRITGRGRVLAEGGAAGGPGGRGAGPAAA